MAVGGDGAVKVVDIVSIWAVNVNRKVNGLSELSVIRLSGL